MPRPLGRRHQISNATDALERLRQIQLTEHEVYDPDAPLEIRVTTDAVAKTITIEDTGVGMTREELVHNLGTIAHSGSKAFLQSSTSLERCGRPSLVNLVSDFTRRSWWH